MIVAGSGHRPEKLGGYDKHSRRSLDRFAQLVLQQTRPDEVISGMALGWDQSLARAAIHEGIPFRAYVPFDGQHLRWPSPSQREWYRLMSAASSSRIMEDRFSPEAMQARNEAMVDDAEAVLALWNGVKSGGTWNCLVYASSRSKKIHHLWQWWSAFDDGRLLI